MSERALVTGATGFIGANLVRHLLSRGVGVHALVRPASSRWRLKGVASDIVMHGCDVRNAGDVSAAFEAARPDWIFHLAAHGNSSWQTDRRGIMESNVLGTVNVVEAAARRGFDALVNAGSSSEYGFTRRAAAETDRLDPASTYAAGKTAATMFCRQMARSLDLPIVTLRLYSAFGPWEDRRRLIPTLLVHAFRGEWPPLVQPDVAHDYIYVDDVVEAFVRAATHRHADAGAVYNIGTGVQTTVGDVVSRVRSVLGVTAEPVWGTMPNRDWDSTVWLADTRYAASALGWTPRYSFDDGLRRFIEWLRHSPELTQVYS